MWNITILRVWYGFSLICTLFLIFDLIHYSWFLRALFFTHANHNMTFPTVITGNQMARRWHLLWVFVPSSQVTGNPLWKKNMWILKAVPFLPKRKFLYKVPIIFLSTQCNVSYGLFQNLSMLASYQNLCWLPITSLIPVNFLLGIYTLSPSSSIKYPVCVVSIGTVSWLHHSKPSYQPFTLLGISTHSRNSKLLSESPKSKNSSWTKHTFFEVLL